MIWPLRRFTAERQTIAAVYRSLAAYAAQLPSAGATAPEPHTLAGTASPTHDPQPFARAAEVLVFQALLDEAERIRASLAALATQQHRLAAASPACARSLAGQCARALAEIADALEGGREPREATPIWEPIEACARDVASSPVVDSLLGQMRAAWRIAGVMSGEEGDRSARHAPLRRRPPIRDALTTLSANLTLRSTALRHALRSITWKQIRGSSSSTRIMRGITRTTSPSTAPDRKTPRRVLWPLDAASIISNASMASG